MTSDARPTRSGICLCGHRDLAHLPDRETPALLACDHDRASDATEPHCYHYRDTGELMPTFDSDGYPSEATLQTIEVWPPADPANLFRYVIEAWHWRDYADLPLTPHEAAVVAVREDYRYVKFATGGWSGNEALIRALRHGFTGQLCWQLSARGGALHIYGWRKGPTR